MREHPILIFLAVVAVLIGSATAYIQSAAFAKQVKRAMEKYVPKSLGIAADFTNLSIQLFPPGVGVVNPKIEVAEKNMANIPGGTRVQAEKMELSFRPLQILSGTVSIHEVRILNGKVKTALVPSREETKRKKTGSISWEDLFEIQMERVALENTAVELELPTLKSHATFNAKTVEVEKIHEDGEVFYDLLVHLGELQADVSKDFPYPSAVDSLSVSARLGSNGLEMKEFELVREGTQATASGKVTGDLLKGTGLKADVSLRLQGDLGRMLSFLSKEKEDASLPQGHIGFDGRASMELDRLRETLSANGVFTAEDLSFRDYVFDRVTVDGSYAAAKDGKIGEIVVKKAVLESKEIPKNGGRQPGLGGRIELGSFHYDLASPSPVETTMKLSRAHIHWLGAELLESLYALDGRISGDTKLKFTPGGESTSFELLAEVDWKIAGLQLDNQRLEQDRKLSRLISLKEPYLKGTVRVNREKVLFESMSIGMEKTQLAVNGEIGIARPTTYEILGGGNVDFSEFGILAENPIEGAGALSIRVHGKGADVTMDFDGSIRSFKYLNLAFGDFRGRVSWSDDTSILNFKNLDCNFGRTRYRLDGKMDLSDNDTGDQMDLKVDVPYGGNINDFVAIFDNLTNDLWWFPRSVTGSMKGSMRVHGGISLSRMMVDASIQGDRWEYFGERFSKVSLKGGYDKGKYFLSDFEGTKRHGRIFGAISFDAKSNYDWKVNTENFTLSDLDRIASLDIPLRGAVSGMSRGKGPEGSVESKTEIRLTDAILRGTRMNDSSLTIETKNGRARLEGNGLGEQATLRAIYDFNLGRESYIELKADHLDFSPLILLLNPSLLQDEALVGRVSGNYRLDFLSGHIELGSGQAKVTEYILKKTDTSFRLDKPYEVRIDRGSFSIPSIALVGDEGVVDASLRSSSGNLSGTIRGKMDLSIAEFFTSAIEKSDGVAEMDLNIAGSVKKPLISGSGTVAGASARIRGVETPIENIVGSFEVDDGELELQSFEGNLASARATMNGTLDFFLTKWPTIGLDLGLNGNKLRFYPFQVAKVRGRLRVAGTERPYLVSGKVLLENAISREKIANTRGPGVRTVQYMPPPSTSSSASIPLFKLDIAVSAPGNIVVQNELMDVEAKCDLRLVGTLENPRPLGTATALRGKILFKDRTFQIQSGTMEFDSATTVNPRYEVLAVTDLQNRRIQLFSTGRFDNQRFEFSSNPPMPENEILNLLALGVTGDDTRKFHSADRSAYEQGEAASLVLHSLDFNREIENKTGFQIAVDEAIDERSATSAFNRSSNTDSAAAPKIVIKRRIGERIGISAGSTVGVGTSTQREVNAEVRVTNGLSVIGVWDTTEGSTTTGADTRQSSFGVDFKLQKRFK